VFCTNQRGRNTAHHVPVRMRAESSLRLHQIIVHNAQDLPKEVGDGAGRGGVQRGGAVPHPVALWAAVPAREVEMKAALQIVSPTE
jgi:hypothetical protein